MIDILYNEKFLKDLKKLKNTQRYERLKEICFEKIEKYFTLQEMPGVKKLEGFHDYYRIRVGDYRIGIKFRENTIILMRVLHRKDFYKKFPSN